MSREGKVDKNEWQDFYNNFIAVFEQADVDKDGLLNQDEVQETYADLQGFESAIKESKDSQYLTKILETLTSRTTTTMGVGILSLNLNEYIFLRRSGIAWQMCANN